MPWTGSTPPFGEVDRARERNRSSTHGQSTLFAGPRNRPGQGSRSHRARYPAAARHHKVAPPRRDRCLSPVFCSRLVVTCSPTNTPFPGSGAHAPRTVPLSSSLLLGELPNRPPGSGKNDAVAPLRVLPALDGQRVGATPTNRNRITTPDRGCPVSQARAHARRCRPSTSREIRLTCAPCRHAFLSPASRLQSRRPGPTSTRTPPRARSSRSEAPSTNESHRLAPSFRPSISRMGRHRCPGFAARGPASDMHSRPTPKER